MLAPTIDGQAARDLEQIPAQDADSYGLVELQQFDIGLLGDFLGLLLIGQAGLQEVDQGAVVLAEQRGNRRGARALAAVGLSIRGRKGVRRRVFGTHAARSQRARLFPYRVNRLSAEKRKWLAYKTAHYC